MKKTTECSFVNDVNIIRKQDKFTISVYRKPTFGGIYTHFDSFLPSTYRISMFHTLLRRHFWIHSDWTMFHLKTLSIIILNRFLYDKHRIQEN